MDMRDSTFIIMDKEYKSGLCLDDFNDQISICSARRGKEDDKVYLDWIFPQGQDRKPISKSLPWKISLGDINRAIKILHALGNRLETLSKEGEPTETKPVAAPVTKEPDEDVAF